MQQFFLDHDLVVQSTQGQLLNQLSLPHIGANESMAPWLLEWSGLHLQQLSEPVLNGGKTVTLEVDLQQRRLRPALLLIRLEPLVRKSRVVGMVVTLQDVTAERNSRTHNQVRDHVEILSALAAPLVELIHTPLSSVLNRLSLALQPGSESTLPDDLRSIEEQIYQLNQVTTALEGLMQYPEYHRRQVDALRTIERAVDVVRMLFSRKEVKFHLSGETGGARVRGNEITLEQALIHVLRNAAEAMPEGGVVSVRCRFEKSEQNLFIEIRDQGEGMTRAECDQAVLPFYRTKSGDHLGLGLTTAFRIFDVHGGGMDLVSAPGEGTTVTIRLPVESRQA